jgi:sec-independent protein translocase protein TatA
MSGIRESILILGLFNLGGGEILLIISIPLLLFGAKNLPNVRRGIGFGIREFRKASRGAIDQADGAAQGAGEALGGICGKPAAQAITPVNHVAELYEPEALVPKDKHRVERRVVALLYRFFRRLLNW